jgi:hypothetical protein
MLAYAFTIFTGAFLLFQVQPLIGKYILPWFGGGPGVWTTCMLFFQTLLLGGYAYAHASSSRLKPRAQVFVHLALLIAALAMLPIIPSAAWKPQGATNPVPQILLLLAATLGLPYFVLSSTGPLLQQWFSRSRPGVSPYRLYALSNVGSLLALVSYPFFFEIQFTRKAQAWMWGWGLVVYGIGSVFCAVQYLKATGSGARTFASAAAPDAAPGSNVGGSNRGPALPSTAAPPATAPAPVTWLQRLLWLLLPACASVLLLATTNKLCLDVAVFPFLWVAPLSLYLLSFVISFDSPRWYVRFPYALLLAAALACICWALFRGENWTLWQQVGVYCGGLFICCMVCHGELYRLRPDAGRLTEFYLLIAAGGALGGLFVAVGAPLIFTKYYELHWGLLLCGILFAVILTTLRTRLLPFGSRPTTPIFRLAWSGSGAAWGKLSAEAAKADPAVQVKPRTMATFLDRLACAVAWLCVAGLGIMLWLEAHRSNEGVVSASRNFYGVLTVYEYSKDNPKEHNFLLMHGRITHGMQFVDPERAKWPTTYFGRETGVGLALDALKAERRIGIIGLGTGTLAAYAREGDYYRIYEINPEVIRLATSRFHYIGDAKAKVDIVLGDARLSMEQDPPQNFDVLVLDAFSGDAIPVHLLTQEAFELYERHLKTNAVIAVHISNHFLDLEPVVLNLARHFNYRATRIDYDELGDRPWLYNSTWMLLSRNQALLDSPAIANAAGRLHTNNMVPLWTDDFASLFQILK